MCVLLQMPSAAVKIQFRARTKASLPTPSIKESLIKRQCPLAQSVRKLFVSRPRKDLGSTPPATVERRQVGLPGGKSYRPHFVSPCIQSKSRRIRSASDLQLTEFLPDDGGARTTLVTVLALLLDLVPANYHVAVLVPASAALTLPGSLQARAFVLLLETL